MKLLITILLFVNLSIQAIANYSTLHYRDSLINYSQTLKGTPYHYGGTSQKGFDCSGFVYYVFKHFNYLVPRTSSSYSNFGKITDLKYCRPGDIMIFTGTKAAVRKLGHIGIVVKNENDVVYFIHSSSSKKNYGVTVTRFNDSGYVKRFLSVINVLND